MVDSKHDVLFCYRPSQVCGLSAGAGRDFAQYLSEEMKTMQNSNIKKFSIINGQFAEKCKSCFIGKKTTEDGLDRVAMHCFSMTQTRHQM